MGVLICSIRTVLVLYALWRSVGDAVGKWRSTELGWYSVSYPGQCRLCALPPAPGCPKMLLGWGLRTTEVEQLGWVACYWDGEVVHLVTALAHKVQLDQRNSHGVATEFVAGIRALCLPSLALPRANPVRTVRGSGMS